MADETTDPPPTAEKTSLAQLQIDIKNSIDANAQSESRQKVIDALKDKVVEKRSNLLLKGLDKLDTFATETRKLSKPDIVQIDGNGVKSGNYSEAAWKAKGEHEQRVTKLLAALNLAIDKGDYTKLEDFLK